MRRIRAGDKFESYSIGTCENCKREGVKVRPVEEVSWLSKASRGWWNICFECFGPTVTWSNKRGTFHSPTVFIHGPDGPMEFQSSTPLPSSEDTAEAKG